MAIVERDGTWSKVNDSLLHIFGNTKDELYQLTFQDITYPDDLKADLALVKQLLDGNENGMQQPCVARPTV
jgi:PAS domain S-box-containing protein